MHAGGKCRCFNSVEYFAHTGDEKRRDPEHKAIKRGEIGRSLSGSIANQQLMLENEGLCGNCTRATWAEELCESNDQVNR